MAEAAAKGVDLLITSDRALFVQNTPSGLVWVPKPVQRTSDWDFKKTQKQWLFMLNCKCLGLFDQIRSVNLEQ